MRIGLGNFQRVIKRILTSLDVVSSVREHSFDRLASIRNSNQINYVVNQRRKFGLVDFENYDTSQRSSPHLHTFLRMCVSQYSDNSLERELAATAAA